MSLLYVSSTLGVTTSVHLMKGGSPIIFNRNICFIIMKQIKHQMEAVSLVHNQDRSIHICTYICPCIYSQNLGKLYIFSYFENIFSIKSGCRTNKSFGLCWCLCVSISFTGILYQLTAKKCYHLVGCQSERLNSLAILHIH